MCFLPFILCRILFMHFSIYFSFNLHAHPFGAIACNFINQSLFIECYFRLGFGIYILPFKMSWYDFNNKSECFIKRLLLLLSSFHPPSVSLNLSQHGKLKLPSLNWSFKYVDHFLYYFTQSKFSFCCNFISISSFHRASASFKFAKYQVS